MIIKQKKEINTLFLSAVYLPVTTGTDHKTRLTIFTYLSLWRMEALTEIGALEIFFCCFFFLLCLFDSLNVEDLLVVLFYKHCHMHVEERAVYVVTSSLSGKHLSMRTLLIQPYNVCLTRVQCLYINCKSVLAVILPGILLRSYRVDLIWCDMRHRLSNVLAGGFMC